MEISFSAAPIPEGTPGTRQEDPPETLHGRDFNRLPIQTNRPLGILEFSRARDVDFRYDATA